MRSIYQVRHGSLCSTSQATPDICVPFVDCQTGVAPHEFKDGEQLRDFVYVKDVVNVIMFLMENKPESGLYNLGTGKARTFIDLANATFKAMNLPTEISFIDTPIDIRDKYQYFTEADMSKLKDAGYSKEFTSLEEGVNDYVVNYLSSGNYH